MNPAQGHALRQLLDSQRIAALGTLQAGEPFVSMVPFALLHGVTFVIHVSVLASHTKNMLQSPRVSLLVAAPDTPERPAQALARVTVQGNASQFTASSADLQSARAAYLARFPEIEETVAFHGFSFFSVSPTSARFIAGFGQAYSLSPETFARALSAS